MRQEILKVKFALLQTYRVLWARLYIKLKTGLCVCVLARNLENLIYIKLVNCVWVCVNIITLALNKCVSTIYVYQRVSYHAQHGFLFNGENQFAYSPLEIH